MKPRVIMLAGPNGAGKSTFFETHLAGRDLPFINADRLAAELGLGAYEAAGVAEEMRRRMLETGESFVTETVFSDPVGAKLGFLRDAHGAGWDTTLFYIGLESPGLSLGRVKARVQAGGHDVPADKVMERYARTLVNLGRAIRELPQVIVYDNSSHDEPYRFVAEFRFGRVYQRMRGDYPEWVRGVLEGDTTGTGGDHRPG